MTAFSRGRMGPGEAWIEYGSDYGPVGYTVPDWIVLGLFIIAIAILVSVAVRPQCDHSP